MAKKQMREFIEQTNAVQSSTEGKENVNNTSLDNSDESGIIKEKVTIHPNKVNEFFLKPGAKHAEDFFNVGYSKDDPDTLIKDLIEGFDYSKAEDIMFDSDGVEKFSVFMNLGVHKRRRFRTVWQKDSPNSLPRIITAHREDDKNA